MKLRNIILTGLACVAFTSCNDFLDVEAPSSYESDYVFSQKEEVNRALNGVYAQLMSGDLYGGAYFNGLCLNSDVDWTANQSKIDNNDQPRRFDCTSQSGTARKLWQQAYSGIETANNFIFNLENSPIYNAGYEDFADLQQMMGEAKIIRAMFYHELLSYFGDIPFTFTPTYESESFVTPVVAREQVYDALIKDLEDIAPNMQFAESLDNGVERASKEAAWAMIARLALSAGGYSLRPDVNNPKSYGYMDRPQNYRAYYQKVMDYAGMVIDADKHHLNKPFQDVFVDECNFVIDNDDDVIFEIPFAKQSSGNVGYYHGPKGNTSDGTTGINIWGGSNGGVMLNAFFRYSFDDEDMRRYYLDGLWDYTYDGKPTIMANYGTRNNKWSKFWTTGGYDVRSSGNTGINFPYLRYADVLLMYAEASNEINQGPTDPKAITAVTEVRTRAFGQGNTAKIDTYIGNANSYDKFKKLVLDERKWEFAGENMRWKDLVRNNLYAETLYYTFLLYYGVAQDIGTGAGANLDKVVNYLTATEITGLDFENIYSHLPDRMFYKVVDNPKDVTIYPNTALPILEIYNPYTHEQDPGSDWERASFYGWWNDDLGAPNDYVLYSLYGYIRGDEEGEPHIIRDGIVSPFPDDTNNLPVVRYLLPYPNDAVQRSNGAYKNYYGY